jgi:Beta-lactamase enzyme family
MELRGYSRVPDTSGDDYELLLRRWHESNRRSHARRSEGPRHPWRARLLVAGALVAVALGTTGHGRADNVASRAREEPAGARRAAPVVAVTRTARRRPAVPSVAAMRDAWRFARRRGGQVSIAVVDTWGRLRGRDAGRRYVSASVVKALLLVAELRRLERSADALDPATREVLTAMITLGDNDAADTIYTRVGDPGLLQVAHSAGMRRFDVSGYWANAQVTAADLARCFSRLRTLLPRRHRRTALHLLAAIQRDQRWGVPRAARGRWRVYFKGGWRSTARGELVHQAAWLRGENRVLAVAILTDAQPSHLFAIHTVRGIADRLLATTSP